MRSIVFGDRRRCRYSLEMLENSERKVPCKSRSLAELCTGEDQLRTIHQQSSTSELSSRQNVSDLRRSRFVNIRCFMGPWCHGAWQDNPQGESIVSPFLLILTLALTTNTDTGGSIHSRHPFRLPFNPSTFKYHKMDLSYNVVASSTFLLRCLVR